jgi:nicotinamidase-related amidase
LIRGERGHDIIDSLAPMAGEIVIDKASYGAFCGTNYYVKDAISCFDPEIRRACEKMIEEEGGIWGALATVEAMIAQWNGLG